MGGSGAPSIALDLAPKQWQNHEVGRRFRVSQGRRRLSWGVGAIVLLALSSSAGAAPESPTLQLAYLDPGTGSMILQAAIATLAGTAVAVSAYWKRIKAYFSRSTDDAEVTDDSARDE